MRTPLTRRAAVLASVLLLGGLSACSSGDGDASDAPSESPSASPSEPSPSASESPSASASASPSDSATPAASGTLTVLAATPLKGTFTELATEFEQDHPGVRVRLRLGGSSDLVGRLTRGAPGDVLATGDATSIDTASQQGLLAGDPVPFASDTLTIAVPPDNPAGIRSFADLARSGTDVAVCATQVPCGAAARAMQLITRVRLAPVSQEASASAVLAKVTSGRADAGLVYVTDVAAAGSTAKAIAIPQASRARNVYPIAALKGAEQADLAREFVSLVTGAKGQAVLGDAGFAGP